MRLIDADALPYEKLVLSTDEEWCLKVADIDAAPTKEQPTWISCAERLPKHGDIVICNTQFFIEVMQWDERSEVWISKTSIHGKKYVDYWLPLKALPQPPKGDE